VRQLLGRSTAKLSQASNCHRRFTKSGHRHMLPSVRPVSSDKGVGHMLFRVTTLIAAASAAATIGSVAPAAHADTADQQFLNLVHSNGVGGQDDTLVTFAHEFCGTNGWLPSGPALYGQGVLPGQLYTIKIAASRVYCPDKIVVPPGPPNVYHGGNL
jgi:hypothetical protein